MIFERALDANEQNEVGRYLAVKYGLAEYCGDGEVTGGEECDDGVNDGTAGTCNTDCTQAPSAL